MGRSSECSIVLPDHRASRHHADIRWNGRSWEVADRGSTNGTYVNGLRVHQPVRSAPGRPGDHRRDDAGPARTGWTTPGVSLWRLAPCGRSSDAGFRDRNRQPPRRGQA